MQPQLIVQITDSHVGVGPEDHGSQPALAAAVGAIGELDPAPVAVLFTGDIAAHGRPEEYARVRELLAPLPMPVHPLMGNHDDREALRAAFADHPGVAAAGEFIQYSVRCGPVNVIACDTHDPETYGGRLGPERLAWIDSELARADGPTILAIHHPPILTGIHEFDVEIPLAPADREALVAMDAQPDLIISGHIHLPVTGRLAAAPVFVCPSVHLQAEFDLTPGADVRLVHDPPGFAIHIHGADSAFVSHVRPIVAGRSTTLPRPSHETPGDEA
jgi:3',5'-cyclic AMP phosphodiesterase CpdA